jgi:hypothetical protein
MTTYFEMPEGNLSGDDPCCGITATAIITGLPFDDAWADLISVGAPASLDDGICLPYVCEVLHKHNIRHALIHLGDELTLEDFLGAAEELPEFRFIIMLTNPDGTTGNDHMIVLQYGFLVDQGGPIPITSKSPILAKLLPWTVYAIIKVEDVR